MMSIIRQTGLSTPACSETICRMKIQIKKVREGAELPTYQTVHSAGMDLHAAIDEAVILQPGERAAIPTGVAIALPPGYEAQVRGRSGLAAKHGVSLANGVGTIDADYRGEIQALIINHGPEFPRGN